MNWYLAVLKKYADFNGRARRQEFWMFTLINILIIFLLAGVGAGIMSATDSPVGMSLYGIYVLGVFIPSLAVAVRRLHDIGKSGWFYFVSLIPLIGSIWLIILLATEGNKGDNEYGSDPKNESPIGDSNVLDSGMVN